MATQTVTYEVVAKAIEEMQQAGEKITFRNVIARTGGAAANVAEYIKKWQQQRKVVESGIYTVSDDVLMAIAKESQRVAQVATNEAVKQINGLSELVNELKGVISSNEVELQAAESMKKDFMVLQEHNTILNNELKSLQVLKDDLLTENALLKQKAAESNKLIEQVEVLNRGKQNLENEVLIWKTKAEQLERQLNTMFKDFINK